MDNLRAAVKELLPHKPTHLVSGPFIQKIRIRIHHVRSCRISLNEIIPNYLSPEEVELLEPNPSSSSSSSYQNFQEEYDDDDEYDQDLFNKNPDFYSYVNAEGVPGIDSNTKESVELNEVLSSDLDTSDFDDSEWEQDENDGVRERVERVFAKDIESTLYDLDEEQSNEDEDADTTETLLDDTSREAK
jgi:hypothetical protein